MDFGWNEEQQRLYEAAATFAQEELNVDLARRDASGEFLRDQWQRCADFGVLGWFVPEELGGSGHDVLTSVRAMEGLGYGCRDNALTLGLAGQVWSVQAPLLHFGSKSQKLKYLPGMCSGQLIAAHAMTEAESGSNAFGLSTRAEKVPGGYRLTGRKSFIGMAPAADMSLVFASTNLEAGRWGVTAFLVERGFDGYRVGPVQSKMGLRTAPMGELYLENCFVPVENRLGSEGSGAAMFSASMDWERGFVFAGHVGSMARQLEGCLKFAKEREVFDQPILEYQAVSHRLAEMRLRLETSRHLLYKVAWKKQRGESAMLEAAMAKLHIGEAFAANSIDAMRIHGGRGYLSEYEVERDLRDALGGVIYAGTSDIQRNIIASLLGKS